MTRWIFPAVLLFSIVFDCRSSFADLTTTLWDVSGVELGSGTTWDDSFLLFTSQTPNGADFALEGYFDWFGSDGSLGRETFVGTLFADSSLELSGTSIGPIPGIGGPSGIGNVDYFATLSNDGSELFDGTWTNVGGGSVLGTWNAVAVPEPSAFAMFGIAMLGLSRRRRLK